MEKESDRKMGGLSEWRDVFHEPGSGQGYALDRTHTRPGIHLQSEKEKGKIMKIEKISIHTQSLESFAEEHDLTMVVEERAAPSSPGALWFATFKDAEVKDGISLIGVIGSGAYVEQAIDDYRKRISEKLIVIDAMQKNRREIQVPRLIA